MRLLFAGTPSVALPSVQALHESHHEVVGVLTQPPARKGRGRKVANSPVGDWALDVGTPLWTPDNVNDADFAAELAELDVDSVAVVAYGQILRQPLLDAVPRGWVNLHFSRLPRWRGAAPVQRAIMAGDPELAVSTFRIVRELDAGPLHRQQGWPAVASESAGEALDRLAHLGAPLLVSTMDDVEQGVEPTPQSGEGTTLAAKLTPADARIVWDADVEAVLRHIRGCNPAPGAWTLLSEDRFKIFDAKPTFGVLPAGEISIDRKEVLVGTATRALSLLTVQPPGKRQMAALDWARGLASTTIERFTDA